MTIALSGATPRVRRGPEVVHCSWRMGWPRTGIRPHVPVVSVFDGTIRCQWASGSAEPRPPA